MGIDGIGSTTTPPQLDASIALEQAESSCQLTSVDGAAPSAVTGSEEAASSSNVLSRLQSGELTREQYLELRVEEAITPFAGHLSPDQLNFMRVSLREQLELNPTLVELTRQATETASVK